MEKYKATMKVEGYFEVEVDAENVDQARRTAIDKYYGADFGQLKDPDAKIVVAEDEDNVWHY